tara:strand:+ start:737 stop:1141 length:405 start_codon:yes stop_codon:yes gene_type:complete
MKLNKSNSNYLLNFINIKTLIFILIFCLLSTKIFGAVNDVYYCEMSNLIMIKDDKKDSYQGQKFKFKRLKNKLQFGSEENYFQDFSLPITFSSGELFSAGDNSMANFQYDDGKFYYGASTYEKAYAINGNCSIF